MLRGNASEILSLSGADGASKGVDSTKGARMGWAENLENTVSCFFLVSFL